MTSSLKVIGMEATQRKLKSLPRQVRFASAKAINECAVEVQKHEVETQLPKKLTLRSKGTPWQKPGNKFGVNIKFASANNLTGIVGTRAPWMKHQEEGGEKKGQGHRVAVPTPFWKKHEEIMHKAKKPRAILEKKLGQDIAKLDSDIARAEMDSSSYKRSWAGKKLFDRKEQSARKAFLRKAKGQRSRLRKTLSAIGTQFAGKPFEAKLSSGAEGIFVRTTKGRTPIKALFWFVDSARVKAAVEFVASGKEILQKNFIKRFGKQLNEALRK